MVTRLLQARYVGLALGVALMLGAFPTGAQAKVVGSMASGAQDLSPRQAREAQVLRLLAEEKVEKVLQASGLTPEQVRSRLDQLSDAQLEELAQNLETIHAGGSAGILLGLVAVILLLMLIYMQIENV
jgi:tetrahydromethanopterin S-methyltransferase subunit G